MSDILYQNGEFISDFIRLYKQNKCLWKRNSKNYFNRNIKRKAYNILHKKYLEVDKNYTEENVKIKIKNLRYAFFKELQKLEESIEKGENYEPKLWYFNEISFIAQREIPKVKENRNKISDIRYWSPAFTKEFISIYKTNECLWKMKAPNYYNREVKLRAYEELRQKLLAIDKNATIDTVKRRIWSLRINFKNYHKNLKKMSKSELTTSKTHYLFDLMFLKDQTPEYNIEPDNSSREFDSSNKSNVLERMDIEDCRIQSQDDDDLELVSNEIFTEEQTYDDDEDVIDQSILDDVEEIFEIVSRNSNNKDELKIEKETNQTVTNSKLTRYTKTSKDSEQISNRKTRTETESKNESKKEINTEQSQNISESVSEKLINNEDECGTYAKYVANEMRLLMPKDRLFLQKIFNDALFEARLGNVTKLKITTGN